MRNRQPPERRVPDDGMKKLSGIQVLETIQSDEIL